MFKRLFSSFLLIIIMTFAFYSCLGGVSDQPLSTIYTYPSDSGEYAYGSENAGLLQGKLIVIDPGHGRFEENYKEPVAPGSSEMKSAYSTGTQGAYLTESEFNLLVAKYLGRILSDLGADVRYTRENEMSLSNIERAEFANDLGADLAVRIHADGSENTSVSGITVLVPAPTTIGAELERASRAAGECVLKRLIAATGANDRGISERSDMTGFNWSMVPVILIECGFMSNPEEDALLSSPDYQQKLADAIACGILDYYSE